MTGVVTCGCKNGRQKDMMCLIEIGIRAQILSTILGSIVNIIGGGYLLYMTIQ